MELSIKCRCSSAPGLAFKRNMSTSRGWSWPVMTSECSGPPRSHDTSCCNFAVWIFWSSAPSRATPTHTVSSVTPAGDKQAGLRTADRLLRLLHTTQIQANYQKTPTSYWACLHFQDLYWNTLERQEHLLACMMYTHENFPCQEKPLPWGQTVYKPDSVRDWRIKCSSTNKRCLHLSVKVLSSSLLFLLHCFTKQPISALSCSGELIQHFEWADLPLVACEGTTQSSLGSVRPNSWLLGWSVKVLLCWQII